jgi:hypothetical protein
MLRLCPSVTKLTEGLSRSAGMSERRAGTMCNEAQTHVNDAEP